MEGQNPVPEQKNRLPNWLTTVTLFSKILAMILFVSLPFAGFYLGMRYQEAINFKNPVSQQAIQTFPMQSSNLNNSSYLKTYKDTSGLFSFQYPNDWKIDMTDEPFPSIRKENITDVNDIPFYSVSFKVNNMDSAISLENYKIYSEKMFGSLIRVDKQEYINVGGIKSIRQEALYEQANYYLVYFIPLNSTKILIMAAPDWGKSIPGISPASGSKYVQAFETIVNSVKSL